MKGRGPRNYLQQEGITFRELSGQKGSGFVVRLLRANVKPPQITTVVKQPGQEHITIETVETGSDPVTGWQPYGGVRVSPESQDTIISTIESYTDRYPLARIVVQHLASAPAEVK